jgi:NADH dehydrogenase
MPLDAVTGADGFSGRHIAARLLEEGRVLVTLTNHPDRADPFGGRVAVRPLAFGDPLSNVLDGVETLYNTSRAQFRVVVGDTGLEPVTSCMSSISA